MRTKRKMTEGDIISGVWSAFTIPLVALLFIVTFMLSNANAEPQSNAPRIIRVIMDDNYPPYIFKDSGGQLKGILPDQWRLWEKKTGIPVELNATDWGEAQRRMEAGEFDVIDTIFRNAKRELIYDFTKPYARLDVPLFFRSDIAGINDVNDLKGFVVAVKSGDNAVEVLRSHGVTTLMEFNSYEAIVTAARDGKVNVFTIDEPPANYFLFKFGINDQFRKTQPMYSGSFHRAVLKGNRRVLDMVEKGFSQISKAEYEKIEQRWYGAPILSKEHLRYLKIGVLAVMIIMAGLTLWLGILKRIVAQKTRALHGEILTRIDKEQRLQESEALLAQAQQIAHLGSWQFDVVTRSLAWSQETYRVFGMESQPLNLSYEMFLDAVHPDDRAKVDAVYCGTQHVEKGIDEIEHRIVRKSTGEIRHVLEKCIHERDSSGVIIRSIGMLQDITERKQAEEMLRASEAKFKALTDTSPLAIYLSTGIEQKAEYINTTFIKLFGYSIDEVPTAGHWWPLAYPDAAYRKQIVEEWEKKVEAAIEQHSEIEPMETLVTCKDGSRRAILWGFKTIGEQSWAFGLDLTEQRSAEEQLRQAQKMELIGRLAGGVAHDFNNMLSVILGNTELALAKVAEDNPLYAHLEQIRSAAGRSANVTRQLLAYARRQTIAPQVLDLNESLEGMLKMLRQLIGEDIDLTWSPSLELWPVKMDPSQLDQILVNLCVNARDAIVGVGKLTIETGMKTFDQAYCNEQTGFIPGDFVMLTVSDDGCGMDKETIDNLFEPFFTTKAVGKGTGLGLATVYGIVTQNNGFIDVYSEPNQGSAFTIYLPRYMPTDEDPVMKPLQEMDTQGHETILLVEDEIMILEMATKMLEAQGYRILAANRPGDAIRLASEHSGEIHLLVTDLIMPEMNGRDLANHLQSLYPQLRCLFMSGYTANIMAHQGLLEGGVPFIHKPFTMKDLTSKIREILNQNPD